MDRFRTWGAITSSLAAIVLCVAPPAMGVTRGSNGAIAFVTWYTNPQIYSIQPDGTGLTQLTSDPSSYAAPAWSPNGRKLLYVDFGAGPGQIFAMNADGSGVRQLTIDAHESSYPAWSPDGRQMAFSRHDASHYRLMVMEPHGAGIRMLTPPGIDAIEPSWSPDGSMIAFRAVLRDGQNVIAVIDVDGTGFHAVTDDPYYEDWQPDWSPDGTEIAFTRCHVDCWVEVMNADGTDVRPLTGGPADYDPAWSPDGTQIAFDTGRNDPQGYLDIEVMNADGSGPHPVTLTPGLNEGDPAWQSLP
jgi:Tol biopolymer transport system component